MPEKKSKADKRYTVDGKVFTWTTDEGDLIELPMRIKLKVVRAIGSGELDADKMFAMLEALVPGSADKLDEMDVNDFQAMFTTWQQEYNLLTGATPGE